MKGTIEIAGLILFAKHGVADEEAKLGQRFSLDLSLEVDATDAVKSDRLDATVDYGEVIAVADAGETMPQKSTYFYPKVPTGLVLFEV